MFHKSSSDDCEKVVTDVYETGTDETYLYLLTYLSSRTARLTPVLLVILKWALSELRGNKFKTTRRLLTLILENFKFMLYTFDRLYFMILNKCAKHVSEVTLGDYEAVFYMFFQIECTKPYKVGREYNDLFLLLCKGGMRWDSYGLVDCMMSLRDQFMYDTRRKLRAIRHYLCCVYNRDTTGLKGDCSSACISPFGISLLVGGDVESVAIAPLAKRDSKLFETGCTVRGHRICRAVHFILKTLRVSDPTNILDVYEQLISYGLEVRMNVVAIMNDARDDLTVTICNINKVISYKYVEHVRKFDETGLHTRSYEEAKLLLSWARMCISPDDHDRLDDRALSFVSLLKAYFGTCGNKVKEYNGAISECLLSYVRLFVAAGGAQCYRTILKKVFQADFIRSSELTSYSRSCQCIVLNILIEDGHAFHDKRLLILLADIFEAVPCFRGLTLKLMGRMTMRSDDPVFERAFASRLRVILAKCNKFYVDAPNGECRPSSEVSSLIRSTIKALKSDGGDVSKDVEIYNEYINKNCGCYGRSLKSSINIDKINFNRMTRLNK